MTLYQTWCYKKALEEWKHNKILNILFRKQLQFD
jgi:hypothetical protein